MTVGYWMNRRSPSYPGLATSWDPQIARASTKGKQAALALKRLKGIRPTNGTVALHVNSHASSGLWLLDLVPIGTPQALGQTPASAAIGSRVIIGAIPTVALVAEAEASIEPFSTWKNAHIPFGHYDEGSL
ncbi:hypothetical protein K432DRAFT_387882 [Lepidopterella palustris CBS 459.81]|uniref:Uncharacterized protein n=1 Tax=Lepidopterella palustris CBS 459.81 TaxID=1314670 RepID=A0A8E2JKZ4_9PEZI|nr:hypothetical protein K432DRAFT_387882 [Lepidopterella palustris CBS 459.81]